MCSTNISPRSLVSSRHDEREVDEFLDEIVVEMRSLSSANHDLRLWLNACQEDKDAAAGIAQAHAGRGACF